MSIEACAGLGRVARVVGQPILRVSLCELQALLGSSGELTGVEEIVLAERLLEQ
jgi:hypothetical protein